MAGTESFSLVLLLLLLGSSLCFCHEQQGIPLSGRAMLPIPTQGAHTPRSSTAGSTASQSRASQLCTQPKHMGGMKHTAWLQPVCEESASTQGRTVAVIWKISWLMENPKSLTTSWSPQAGWDQFPQSSWMGFFNRKAKLMPIFAKQFNWKRKKRQFYRLFIQIRFSLKSTYYLHALGWVTVSCYVWKASKLKSQTCFRAVGSKQLLNR